MHSLPISYPNLSGWKKLPDFTFDDGLWANLDEKLVNSDSTIGFQKKKAKSKYSQWMAISHH